MLSRSKLLLVALAAAQAVPLSAEESVPEDLTAVPPIPREYAPAKTPWGDPDLRGRWPIDHLNGTPLQRAPEQGNRVFLTEEEMAARAERIRTAAARYDNEHADDRLGQGHWGEMGQP